MNKWFYLHIDKIGKRLVKCSLKCKGIVNDSSIGIIPRCLYLEKQNGTKKIIILGLNPGKSNFRGDKERNYYLENGASYKNISEYWIDHVGFKHKYYKNLRQTANLIGFDGNILWTELAKCELEKDIKEIPIETLRICINKWLVNEIKKFKCNTILAVGNRVFDFCALSFPSKTVIGIPHPTGSYGHFNKFFKNLSANKNKYLLIIQNNAGKAVFLK